MGPRSVPERREDYMYYLIVETGKKKQQQKNNQTKQQQQNKPLLQRKCFELFRLQEKRAVAFTLTAPKLNLATKSYRSQYI